MRTLVMLGLFGVAACGRPKQLTFTFDGPSSVAACVARLWGCPPEASAPPLGLCFEACIGTFESVLAEDLDYRNGTPSEVDCLAQVGANCDEVMACMGTSADKTCSPWGSTCNAEVATNCDVAGTEIFDCASVGLHCLYGLCAHSDCAGCGVANCAQPNPGFPVRSCDGDHVMSCETERLVPITNCAAIGQVCSNGICIGTGPACVPQAPPLDTHCEGDVLVGCAGGFETRLDCTASGRHCVIPSGSHASCGLGDECGTGFSQHCDGSAIVYCYQGQLRRFECSELGFSGCTDDLSDVFCGSHCVL